MKNTKIDIEKIEELSSLSAISFTDQEKGVMVTEVSGILEMLDACANVKKDKMDARAISLNELREDIPCSSMKRDDVLEFAPRVENGYIVVPKVVD